MHAMTMLSMAMLYL